MSFLFMFAGAIAMVIGLVGMIRFDTFYARLMAATLIDTVGYILFLSGIMIYSGWNTVTLKIAFLLFAVVVINPIFTHFIIQSAWKSGHKEKVKE